MDDADFMRKLGNDGIVALLMKHIGQGLQCQVLAGPLSFIANIDSQETTLKELLKFVAANY